MFSVTLMFAAKLEPSGHERRVVAGYHALSRYVFCHFCQQQRVGPCLDALFQSVPEFMKSSALVEHPCRFPDGIRFRVFFFASVAVVDFCGSIGLHLSFQQFFRLLSVVKTALL